MTLQIERECYFACVHSSKVLVPPVVYTTLRSFSFGLASLRATAQIGRGEKMTRWLISCLRVVGRRARDTINSSVVWRIWTTELIFSAALLDCESGSAVPATGVPNATPGVSLSTSKSAISTPLGWNTIVDVGLTRTGGFTAGVELSVEGLPLKVTAAGPFAVITATVIRDNGFRGTVTLEASGIPPGIIVGGVRTIRTAGRLSYRCSRDGDGSRSADGNDQRGHPLSVGRPAGRPIHRRSGS